MLLSIYNIRLQLLLRAVKKQNLGGSSPSPHYSSPGNRCCILCVEPKGGSKSPDRSCYRPLWMEQVREDSLGVVPQRSSTAPPHSWHFGTWQEPGSIPWPRLPSWFGEGAVPLQQSDRHFWEKKKKKITHLEILDPEISQKGNRVFHSNTQHFKVFKASLNRLTSDFQAILQQNRISHGFCFPLTPR